MGQKERVFGRRVRQAGVAAVVTAGFAALTLGGGSSRPAGAAAGCTTVVGKSTAAAPQLAGWFDSMGRRPKLDVTVLALATMFVEEGAREGIRGDIAFAQAIVETGYFGFSPSVPPEMHNYSGIGATGGGVKGAGFPDARTGVRAQIQHLRAYADPSLRSAADLKAPLVDPRFHYLVPNSRSVPCWEQFGSGVWAADTTGYGPRVLSVHQRITAFPAPRPVPAPAPLPTPAADPALAGPSPAIAAVVATAEEPPKTIGDVVLADLAATSPPIEATSSTADDLALAEISARPAASTSQGSGVAAALACLFTGAGLLAICTTLWWHGRRFSRA